MSKLTALYTALNTSLTKNGNKLIYKDIVPGRITNFSATLKAINCTQIEYLKLSNSPIKIEPKVSPTGSFKITGGMLVPFPSSKKPIAQALPAEIHFIEGLDKNVFLFIVFSPKANVWNLGKTFELPTFSTAPNWEPKPNFLSTLKFEAPHLILSGSSGGWFDQGSKSIVQENPNNESVELSFGLNFIGKHTKLATTNNNKVLKAINLLYIFPSPLVQGNIYNDGPSGQLYLIEKFDDLDISFPNPLKTDETISMLSVKDAKILYQSDVNNVSSTLNSQPTYNAGVQLYAKLNFAGDGALLDVIYNIPLGVSKTIVLKSQLIKFNPGKVLKTITGGAITKLLTTAPAELKSAIDTTLTARGLEVAFDVAADKTKKLKYLSSTVSLEKDNWKIAEINGCEFTAKNPELSFTFGWDKTGKLNDKRLGFGASVILLPDSNKPKDELILDLKVSVASGVEKAIAFSGVMSSGEFSVVSIVKTLMPNAPKLDSLDDLNVTALSISAAKGKNTTLRFGMTVESAKKGWKPLKGCALELSDATIQMNYDKAVLAPNSKFTGFINASFKLGDLELFAQAEKQLKGWIFKANTESGSALKIRDVLKNLSDTFLPSGKTIPCPEVLSETIISKIALSFSMGTPEKELNFELKGKIPIGDQMADISVLINKTSSTFEFTGSLEIGYRHFEFSMKNEGETGNKHSLMIASYKSETNSEWFIKDAVNSISSEIAEFIPSSLSVTLKDAFFILSSVKQGQAKSVKTFLLGVDIGAGVDLTDLPLIGNKLPSGTNMAIDNLRVMVASKPITNLPSTSIIPDINEALQKVGIESIPDQPNPAKTVAPNPSTAGVILQKGLNFSCNLTLNNKKFPVLMAPSKPKPTPKSPALAARNNVPQVPVENAPVNASPPTVHPSKPGRGAVWVPIQRAIGPIHFDRIGVAFKKGELTFLLDADLTAGKLCLSMEGLSVASPITNFAPHFGLAGLGLSYKSPTVDIGGALLKADPSPENTEYAYDGFLQVRAKKLTLTALGSYAKMKTGEPSFFVYVNVDYPLGGPAFFFVMGFTAGFGYNRRLVIPTLDQMTDFPLVSQALNGAPAKTTGQSDRDYLMNQLNSLEEWIPPAVGEYFIAAGIKFTTFKIVNSFALLAFSFGKRMRLDLFGHTFLVHPPVSPDKILSKDAGTSNSLASMPFLVNLKMDLMASYLPEDGILEAKGAIKPGSYVYSPLAHIDGNFAFKSWFKGNLEGDFVFALGGYHPDYKEPAHYPARSWLKPLSIHYGINPNLYVKGSLYFALTPGALMAGGTLEAVFNSGPLHASFNAYADFLVYYKPFHYDARIGVNVHINFSFDALFVTVHISLDAGANLHVWGPDFSGTADVHFLSFSRRISFGAGRQAPPPITWKEFTTSFLPAPSKSLNINCHSGLIQTYKHKDGTKDAWLVDPKNLSFAIESTIPLSKVWYTETKPTINSMVKGIPLASHAGVGIKPMHAEAGKLISELYIYISHNEGSADNVLEFSYHPIVKNQPAGLWGDYHQSALSDQVVPDVLTGVEIKPGTPPKASATKAVDSKNLNYNTEVIPSAFAWEKHDVWVTKTIKPEVVENKMASTDFSQLLKGLVSDEIINEVSLTKNQVKNEMKAFVEQPQNKTWKSI